jgi:hypothetical protein
MASLLLNDFGAAETFRRNPLYAGRVPARGRVSHTFILPPPSPSHRPPRALAQVKS